MRVLAALLSLAMLAGCNVEADFSDNLKTETLSAEKYQQQIVAIDRLVFQEKALGDDGVQSLEKDLNDLAARVKAEKEDSRFLKLESLELRLLASRAGRLSPDGTGAALQDNWMRIRNNLFDDRAWFARSANDLDYAASVTPPDAETSAPPPAVETAQPEPAPEFESRSTLTGTWQVVSILANGRPRSDEELTGSTWTFDAPRMMVRDGKGNEKIYNFTADREYLAVTSASGEDGWMKYQLDDQGLRIAFFDGLKGKPSSFDASPRQDPLLVVVRLAAIR